MMVYVVWYEEPGGAHCYECGKTTPITRMEVKAIFTTKANAYAYRDGGRHDWSLYHVEEMEVQP